MVVQTSAHLDLGCATKPRNPYGRSQLYGLDINDHSNELVGDNTQLAMANLALDKIPFADNFFSSVSAFDLLEHIPPLIYLEQGQEITYPFIRLMDEIWRVLAPGGRFLATIPAYPSAAAFVDPTHVNYITDKTHEFFCGADPEARRYGFQGRYIAHIAKFSDTKNVEQMPPRFWRSQIRDFARKFDKRGLQHVVWELEAIK